MIAPRTMAAEKDTLNATDVAFVKTTGAAGMAEVKIASLGVTKATRADVKALAEMLVTDHTKVNAELKVLATKKGIELSDVISPSSAETFQKLEKLSGTEFDKEFLADIVADHKTCVNAFDASSKDAKDTDVRAFVDKTLPALKAHHAKAVDLQSK